SADVNGDDYQNIEIPLDSTGTSPPVIVDINDSNQAIIDQQDRPDTLNLTIEKNPKTLINISRIGSITTDEESGADSVSSSRRESKLNPISRQTSNQWNDEKLKIRRLSTASTIKSSFSAG
ncbi:unnamed protein product, partial [Adineta steineri]